MKFENSFDDDFVDDEEKIITDNRKIYEAFSEDQRKEDLSKITLKNFDGVRGDSDIEKSKSKIKP